MQARPMDLPINGFITTDHGNGHGHGNGDGGGKRVHMFVHRDMPTLLDDAKYYDEAEGQWRKKRSRIVR